MQSHAKEEKLKSRRPIAREQAIAEFQFDFTPKSILETDSDSTDQSNPDIKRDDH
jgi:hypothetical protein